MKFIRGRYSWLLRPFLVVYDLFIINSLVHYYFDFNNQRILFFSINFFNDKFILYFFYSIISWMITTPLINFYKVYRYTSVINIFSLLAKQAVVFGLTFFAFIGAFRSIDIDRIIIFKYIISTFILISLMKLMSYYALKSFRSYLNGNKRHVVIIGKNEGAAELKKLFTIKKELGYNLLATFTDSKNKGHTGTIEDSFDFIENNWVDEIYCSIDELTEKQVNEFVKISDKKNCNIKFIPNTDKLGTKLFKTDFYSYLPVLSIQEVALNNEFNKLMKRTLDVVFSLFIIVFVLSWVSIILYILIKLESKGPLVYKHKRNGINYKEFNCYKFRSLRITEEIEGTYVKKNDNRVTRIGAFLRRTSLDELPQFINVLKGDMSVVGPRPHMPSYTEAYSKKIDKYNFIFRHNVKPGLTGLAQIKGYRGEIKNDDDIINRVKYDIYYIENWSLFLDIKIIILTFFKIFTGQKEAY